MSRKCIYCKTGISEDSVIDFCKTCGHGVWGENMFNAIVKNMENARDVGDLYQGSVTHTPGKDSPGESIKSQTSAPSATQNKKLTLAQEAIQTLDSTETNSMENVETYEATGKTFQSTASSTNSVNPTAEELIG